MTTKLNLFLCFIFNMKPYLALEFTTTEEQEEQEEQKE